MSAFNTLNIELIYFLPTHDLYIPNMLKIEPKPNTKTTPTTSEHLKSKGRMIVITNVCNLNCGGCCQLIGHFEKKQLWFLSLGELHKNIRLLTKYPSDCNQPITIFGGEPTLHPQWNEIMVILKSYAPTIFWVNTNGRLGHKRYQKEGNLVWWVDLHPDSQLFVQTMYAAVDAVKLPNDMAYWEKAQKDCCMWKGCQCSLYNGKAYFCETAAAIDWLYNNGENGWKLDENKHPFKRNKEEIDEQARHLCKRCGWCVTNVVPRQLSKDPSYISPYNKTSKIKHSLMVIEPVPQHWRTYDTTTLPPSIGIYRLAGKANCPDARTAWFGVTEHKATSINEAIIDGRNHYDWTIVLEGNQTIPNQAFSSMIGWLATEATQNKPRLHISLPIYEIPCKEYDPNMAKPSVLPKDVVIGFHKNSKEIFDNGIYSRLGHRNMMEGSGRPSLWHDDLTDIVGAVVSLI